MRRQHKLIRKLSSRRVIAIITLFALLLSVLPLSIPSTRSHEIDPNQKDQSQPFPCMNRPCGCNTAAQCWKECCCFNKQEKLAWARKNGVTPPSFLTDDLEPQSFASNSQLKSSIKKKSCCLSKNENEFRVIKTIPEDKSLCGVSRSCCTPKLKKRSDKTRNTKKKAKDVIGFFVQKCRGNGNDWTTLPWLTLEETDSLHFTPDLEVTLGLISIELIFQSYPPALPPPQC